MKKRLAVIGLLVVSSVSMAIDYKALYLEEQKKTQAIIEQINKVRAGRELYKSYYDLYENNAKHYSFNNTITKQYLDYNYTISENKVTDYINSNLIDFHQSQIDEMVTSIRSNKPTVKVVVDKDYDVYINGSRVGSNGAE